MIDLPARLPGLNLTVGGFLPRLRLPSLSGSSLAPADIVQEGELGVCVYNPGAVNPFPLPPKGVDLARRYAMLLERSVSLFVISGLKLPLLASWLDRTGMDFYALSDTDGEFASHAGVPIKRAEGHNFRTHVSFVLQEDRILAMLLETDPVHQFERLLQALDVAEGKEPGVYVLDDQPWYVRRRRAVGEILEAEAEDEDEGDEAPPGEPGSEPRSSTS